MKTRSPSPKKALPKKISETVAHSKLKTRLGRIFAAADLKFDQEIALNFTGQRDSKGHLIDERSMDFAAFGRVKGRAFLLVFECKSGARLKEMKPHKEISSWQGDTQKLLKPGVRVISSDKNAIKARDLQALTDIRICYILGGDLEPSKYRSLESTFKSGGLYTWNRNALAYYERTAHALQKAVQFQILRELDLSIESNIIYSEPAIRVQQRGMAFYVFAAQPSVLLKIAYVYRRASGQPQAYQRILSKDRIDRISEFLRVRDALLPNAIIIAFDNDPDVQKHVSFSGGKLSFSGKYCSAWIIDGQHRVYGFVGTPLGRLETDPSAGTFELPVVAFKSLDAVMQNRTFVSINYNQKKIDPTLLCDLATAVPDLRSELTWPSMLVAHLNSVAPLLNKVKISELDERRPITISSFARYGLLEGLLGYDRRARVYSGPLNAYSPFIPRASVKNRRNREALTRQAELLARFFSGVEHNTKDSQPRRDPWQNTRDYSLLGATGINALLLTLARIMEKYPNAGMDFNTYLRPLRSVDFHRGFVAKQGGGWKGFRKLANVILRKLNVTHGDSLRLFGKKDKK